MDVIRIRDLPSGRTRRQPATLAGGGDSFLTRKRLLMLLSLALITILALFYLWQSWQWVYWLNQLHQAQAQLENLQAQRDQLKFELGRAFSLDRIERIATQKLAMFRPTPKYLKVLPVQPFQP